ncbi:MAG: hypothetical protein FJW36_20575 [Acidobacteria bacterium]|nr:hypothetical protein [Acidobacteriota bacterium]
MNLESIELEMLRTTRSTGGDPTDLPGTFPIDPPVETVPVPPADLLGSFPIDPPVETVPVSPDDLPGDFPIPVPEPDDSKG